MDKVSKISQNIPNKSCKPHRDTSTHILLETFLSIIQIILSEKIVFFNLEDVENRGFSTGGRSAFFYWNVFSLEDVKKRGLR